MTLLHLLNYEFIQRAYLAGSFIAVLCAILGLFLVLRKLSLIGDGLSHVSFGAIALGLFLGFYPFYVAIPLVIMASYLVLKLTEKARIYGDAAIGIVSAVGIAGGVLLASLSNGFNVDLFSYLFGNILAISSQEVLLSVGLSVVILLVIIFLYNDLFSTTFDEQFAKITGINTKRINVALMFLTAITVVLADCQRIQVGDDYGGGYRRFRGPRRHHHLFLRRLAGRRHGGDGKFLAVCLVFSCKKIGQIIKGIINHEDHEEARSFRINKSYLSSITSCASRRWPFGQWCENLCDLW
jgi:zinc transport system permease protein